MESSKQLILIEHDLKMQMKSELYYNNVIHMRAPLNLY